jgi:hypothetical protein
MDTLYQINIKQMMLFFFFLVPDINYYMGNFVYFFLILCIFFVFII